MTDAGETATEPARAKINLTLRVLGRRTDGYHELESLVAFAGVGDVVTLRSAAELSLAATGPFAGGIDAENLVLRAAQVVSGRWPEARLGAFGLEKRLPVAAGLGGGSADAAAALRLLRLVNPGLGTPADWQAIAATLGADVPVCLLASAAFMTGIGERVTPLPPLPPVAIVLVNPGVPLATASVFRALAATQLSDSTPRTGAPGSFASAADLVASIARMPNDLEPTARRLCPVIGDIEAALAAQPGCLLQRLSGSGPTAYGLFGSRIKAERAAAAIARAKPAWWTAAAVLT